jgi:uncharacterized protein YfaS (alpha-2-macroglobulin family)
MKTTMTKSLVILIISMISLNLTASTINHESIKKLYKYTLEIPTGYEELWYEVDSLKGEGLPKSALEVVEKIYQKSKKEHNTPQYLKAVIYKSNLVASYAENYMHKIIDTFNEELETAVFPENAILHSCIAELYFSYYQQNRYKYLNRTHTVDFKQDDLDTWDLRKIMNEVVKHYMSSIENKEDLYKIKLKDFSPILVEHYKSKEYRPTLYDFLAHRAIDFFMNTESGLTQPNNTFNINNKQFLEYYTDFVNLEIKTEDSLSLKYYAVSTFQNLIEIHANDKDAKALIDVELKRLKYFRNKLKFEEKDSLYIQNLRKLEKEFSKDIVVSDIKLAIADFWYGQGSKYSAFTSPEYQWDYKKALLIYNNILEKYPKSNAAQSAQYQVYQMEYPSVTIQTQHANVPSKPFLSYVSYKNTEKLYFKVCKADYNTYYKYYEKYYSEELLEKLLKFKSTKEWSVDLPSEGDYQSHATEIAMPELSYGFYLVFASTDPEFNPEESTISYGNFWITDIAYSSRQNEDYSFDIYAASRSTGKALKNITIKQYKRKYNYQIRTYERIFAANHKTDKDGFFKLPTVRSYNNSSYSLLEFINGEDRYIPEKYFYQYSYDQRNDTYKKTFFFTDRGIYRPGQTIHFKAIVLEYDEATKTYKIVPNYKTTVGLYDVNYQQTSELALTTNEYGSVSGTFELPMGMMNGQMRIDNGHGNKYFSVEEYKRPQFEVKMNKVKGTYKLNDNVQVTGNAKSYAGHNIDGAQVKYRVTRTARFPYWGYWWGYYRPTSAAMEITNGEVKTDDKGVFTINFDAIPDYAVDKKYQPVFYYQITADVTDLNGETHSTTTAVPVGYTALFVDVSIPAKVNKATKDNEFHIKTQNLNGVREHNKGTIKIYKLIQEETCFKSRTWSRPDKHVMTEEEFHKNFPYDQYDDENNKYGWEKGKEVLEYFYNTSKDSILNLNVVRGWNSGHYLLVINSNDKYGNPVENKRYFEIYATDEKQIPDNSIDYFEAIKTTVEPGEKVQILIGTADDNLEYVYEIEHKNKIIKRERITLNKEQKIIEIPVIEEYRGNFVIHLLTMKNNRSYSHSVNIYVPYTNKQIDIEFQTFRNKLMPGEEEEWKLTLKGKNGDKVAAEMLATMYDASLDAFAPNNWNFNIFHSYYSYDNWDITTAFSQSSFNTHTPVYEYYSRYEQYYDQINWHGMPVNNYYWDYYSSYDGRYLDDMDFESSGEVLNCCKSITTTSKNGNRDKKDGFGDQTAAFAPVGGSTKEESERSPNEQSIEDMVSEEDRNEPAPVQVRSNFSETAFFLPHLQTNEKGEVVIKFTVPESLTRWKMMGFAHTKDLDYGFTYNELVTQKELMIIPNAPRFLRENDKINFTAKISNISEKDLEGVATLEILDAITMNPVSTKFGIQNTEVAFSVEKGVSTVVSWDLNIPENIGAVTYRVIARAGSFSDGEEKALPVLTNRMLVTESLPLPIRGNTTKTFNFKKLIENNSSTLTHHRYTLEFTSNPAWYAIQALPYMMEYPYECAEQTFTRFYANSIAFHIANSSPKIKAVFESWKTSSPEAFLSNLEKNQELKSLLLEETPWVLDAKDESERKKRIALLFDMNKMSNELQSALRKLEKLQVSNGGFPWFKGMRDNRYITQHIVTGFGHLDHLGITSIRDDNKTWRMITNAVRYLDMRIKEDYEDLIRWKVDMEKDHLSQTQIQYLYARSYFIKDLRIPSSCDKAFEYYKEQAEKYWLNKSIYMQGMISLGLNRMNDSEIPMKIIKSLREKSIVDEEMGMYWRDLSVGYYWYQSPIETQALLIECFDEVADDQEAVEEMKIWLLKQKQTQDWKTTKATAEACYALLLKGVDILESEELVEIEIGGKLIEPEKIEGLNVQAGTGYFKTAWPGSEITSKMGEIKLTKKDDGIAWGAVYWQYFEQLDKITPAETPLKLEKKLFVEEATASGPVLRPIDGKTVLKVGDKVKVRIVLRVDRDMEFVHMKDMRASCFEPTNVISRYKYQGGLGYYESTKDASTNFFFDYLNKGTYVFEYPLLVTHTGNFSNGITSIQCMYAPEFSSHSEGVRVTVK